MHKTPMKYKVYEKGQLHIAEIIREEQSVKQSEARDRDR